MVPTKLVTFLCACAFFLQAEGANIRDGLSSIIPKAEGSSSANTVSIESWPQDIQEEMKIWEEQNAMKPEPRGLLSAALNAVENFLFDDGVPSEFAPFSSASPEQIAKNVILHLYTRETTDHNITGPVNTLVSQGFHPNASTTLLIHGYGHDTSGAAVQPIKERILATATAPVNVIGVDWSKLCPKPHYVWSRSNVKPAGEFIGGWLAQVVRQGLLRPSDIHLIGHSLGAHIGGTAGAAAGKILSVPVARVTGLDPAYPLFARSTPDSGKISASDATLVDIIHTAAGRLGLRESVGHVDFFANGGTVPQPGCGIDLSASCSHERVCFLYAESVGKANAFPGRLCPDDDGVSEEKCTGVEGHMGDQVRFRYDTPIVDWVIVASLPGNGFLTLGCATSSPAASACLDQVVMAQLYVWNLLLGYAERQRYLTVANWPAVFPVVQAWFPWKILRKD